MVRAWHVNHIPGDQGQIGSTAQARASAVCTRQYCAGASRSSLYRDGSQATPPGALPQSIQLLLVNPLAVRAEGVVVIVIRVLW
jgi:hypothetical protein